MTHSACSSDSCFFCGQIRAEWRELAAMRRVERRFRKGERLIAEGGPVLGMYMILEGSVKVHRSWGNGRELIVRFGGCGEVVGFRGIGAGDVYPVSATAMEPVRCCFIPLDFLETSLEANPGLSRALMQLYARELKLAEQRMSDLAHMGVKGRLARTLLTLQSTLGKDEAGFIRIPVSRQDIASHSGTIYETVFKIFTEWIGQGLIFTEGKRVQVLNEPELAGLIC